MLCPNLFPVATTHAQVGTAEKVSIRGMVVSASQTDGYPWESYGSTHFSPSFNIGFTLHFHQCWAGSIEPPTVTERYPLFWNDLKSHDCDGRQDEPRTRDSSGRLPMIYSFA